MNPVSLTIDGARSAVQQRTTTAVALAEAHYTRIQKEDGQIGAFLTLSKERAMQQAERVDRMVADANGDPAAALLIEGAALHLDADLKWLALCEQRLTEEVLNGHSPAD